ncbi:MAG: hypothetical protein ACREXW_06085 [Gammaproteobacteria bacterium]
MHKFPKDLLQPETEPDAERLDLGPLAADGEHGNRTDGRHERARHLGDRVAGARFQGQPP